MTAFGSGGKLPVVQKVPPIFPTNWEEVCNNPYLANLPYKVEINRFGKIELSPHNRWQSAAQAQILRLLDRFMTGGQAMPECAVKAPNGSTPVPDMVWESEARTVANRVNPAVSVIAPEICVEVRSPGNTRREMEDKLEAYFGAGALEVWFCGENGTMHFHGPEGPMERSRLCPEFPARVEVNL